LTEQIWPSIEILSWQLSVIVKMRLAQKLLMGRVY